MTNDLFLRACRRQDVERTPVWIMRQAGRYLPEYRAVRARHDFLTMCKTPEIASEVTIQPVEIIGVDAAILFSDILVVPEAMGMHLTMVEGEGPRFSTPLRSADDLRGLKPVDPERQLRFVMDAIAMTRRGLNGRVPLIGFSGSPWTLASYMIEGGGSKDFRNIKKMMIDEPALLEQVIDLLTVTIRRYCEAQVASGAQAIQIFDTWGGILDPDHYRKFSLDPMFEIVSKMQRGDAPVIVFSRGAAHALKDLAAIGADVVGLDWTMDIASARSLIGEGVALQGNLDPAFLYASPENIRKEVRSVLRGFGPGPGHIFNLGHGILPGIPVDHAIAMVRSVHEESPAFHL